MKNTLLAIFLLLTPLGLALEQAAEVRERLDLNTATQSELEGLPGIGPALAKRIIDFREDNGKFRRVEDLLNVRGIGKIRFEKLRPLIRVGGKSGRDRGGAPRRRPPSPGSP